MDCWSLMKYSLTPLILSFGSGSFSLGYHLILQG